MTVAREPLTLTRVRTGTLRYRTRHRVYVREEARIDALPWFEGDAVPAGEVVLRLDRQLLDASLARAEAVRADAEAQVRQFERLGRSRAVAADEVRRARTALAVADADLAVLRTRASFTVERAPFAALVSERLAEPGDFVAKGEHVLTLVDPASLTVDVDIDERLLTFMAPGTPARLRIDAVGDTGIEVTALRVHSVLDERTRQGRVEFKAAEWPAAARAGQLARVELALDAGRRLMLPPAAVRRDVEGDFVYRVRGDEDKVTANRTPVRVGRRFATRVELLDGVLEGDRVVLRGFLGLRDGKAVVARDSPAEDMGAPS